MADTTPQPNPFDPKRLEALAFRPQGVTWDQIVEHVEGSRLRGAIVGPHGSGKTALLNSLAAAFEMRGLEVVRLFVNTERPNPGALPAPNPNTVVMFDGADLISPWRWLAVKKMPRLIITSHREGMLPTLIQTATSPALLRALVMDLVGDEAAVSIDVDDLFTRHNGNLRAALLELYDRHASAV